MSRKIGFESTDEFRFMCTTCGVKGAFWNVVKKIGYCFHCEKPVFEAPPEVSGIAQLPQGYTRARGLLDEAETPWTLPGIWDQSAHLGLAYILKRGVPCDNRLSHLRFSPDTNAIYFPVMSPSPEFIPSWIYRQIDKKFYGGPMGLQKKRGGYVYGLDKVDTNNKFITIVEGPFDVLTHLPGISIATLGTNLSETTKVWLAQNYKTVIIWYDPDAEAKAVKYARELVRTFGIDAKAVTGHTHDAGECRCGTFLEALKEGVVT